jgi:uncharacterized membrane protein
MQPLDRSAAESGTQRARGSRRGAVAIIVALLAVLALFLLPPHDLLDKADRFAYAVCHRIPSHSLFIGGRQLPLCARCSGTYLGALAGIAVLLALGRGRANRFPAPKFLLAFGIFMAAWAIDGANSYASFFLGLPQLYEPNNLLRLATGVLEGLVIAAFILPLFNMTVWAATDAQPSIVRWRDLGWMLVGGAAVFGLVVSEWEPLLYPLALLSGAMVVLLVGAICVMLVLMIARRDGQAQRWREIAFPLLAGLAVALAGLAAIGLFRDLLTRWFGLPF